jgi:hypothetical protein
MSNSVLKQEGFSIEERVQELGIQQDRIQFTPDICFLNFNDIKMEVVSLSSFECTVQCNEKQLKEFKAHVLKERSLQAELEFHNQNIQTTTISWQQTKTAALGEGGEVTLEFEVQGEPIQVERLQAIYAAMNVVTEQKQYAELQAILPVEFKNTIYEIRDFLTQLKIKMDKLESETPPDNLEQAQVYRQGIADTVSAYLLQAVPIMNEKAAKSLDGLSEEQMKAAVQFSREQIGHLIYGAPFANRAFYKPRGYAGDYEMMNHLYRNELVGKTLFDQTVHKYLIDEPAGAAVKNRGQYLFGKIKELFGVTPPDQPLKVISIASGPAMEQQLFLQHAPEYYGRSAEFTCLDQDEQSLKHAQKQLRSLNMAKKSGYVFKFNNMAIKNVIGSGLPQKDYDMIYSAGLFDYFNEVTSRAAAVKMIASLKSGGQLVIGNFSKNNPSVPVMELFLDWKLIYRSEEDLLRIFQGLGSKIWVEKEPLGINLFVVIQK